MKKLLLGVVAVMIAASPALAHGWGASWRSDRSSAAPPVMGKTFGAYPYGPLNFVNPYPAPGEPVPGEKAEPKVHKR